MTLTEAIEMRLRQADLCGWRLSRRRQVEIIPAGAILTLGWLDDRGMHPAEPGAVTAGDHAISVDTTDLPPGIDVLDWCALPNTRDLIDTPSEAEIRAAADRLGCRHVDRGEGAGHIIYWMVI